MLYLSKECYSPYEKRNTNIDFYFYVEFYGLFLSVSRICILKLWPKTTLPLYLSITILNIMNEIPTLPS